ncbi:FlgD immunoglobulin-like domain containing protein [uncultured Kriegella sp.]|uniref:FlgD immunoglobulin-like domain containing protein n=1 Tax=uncultured Kriegella sp. TaxID=1798910 RepID=UPI0030DAC62B
MKCFNTNCSIFFLLILILFSSSLNAQDLTGGLTKAAPVKNGISPLIDGELDDWDLSFMEPCYASEQTIEKLNGEWALMYDDNALYIAGKMSLPGRPYKNEAMPTSRFWQYDLFALRLSADPKLNYPLTHEEGEKNDRVAHISIWKNTNNNQNYLHIIHGTRINLDENVNPEGSKVAIKTDGELEYTVEVAIPWSALNVPDGKNPFKPGDRTAFVFDPRWTGGTIFSACFRKNPGHFAFHSPSTWGQMEFSATSPGERIRPTMKELIAEVTTKRKEQAPKVGIPIQIEVPEDSLKVSVNILDNNGEIIRELVGGESTSKGSYTAYWDGYDAWKKPMKPGSYKWGAYFHKGLKAEYFGSVGTSGNPPYNTFDGKGGWGGDHSNPVDCVVDESGIYFLWSGAEAGKAVVKTDFNGKVLWRKTPFVKGGFGPHYTMAADGKYLYVTLGENKYSDNSPEIQQITYLFKMDVTNGALLTWDDGKAEKEIFRANLAPLPLELSPMPIHLSAKVANHEAGISYNPDCMGIAKAHGKIYMASNNLGKIFIINPQTGEISDQLACAGVRGINFDTSGNLYAVTAPKGADPKIIRFEQGVGKRKTVVSRNLEVPYDVAVDRNGQIFVSNQGEAQQVKIFSNKGKIISSIGKRGGRPWQGKYDQSGLLNPTGLCIDKEGRLLVTESSLPKVFSRFSIPDGKLENRWFGPGVYWNSTWPMPDDPKHVFYMLTDGIGRGNVTGPLEVGEPDAYWDLSRTPYSFVGSLERLIPQPEVIKADNNKLYLVKDTDPHSVLLMENDVLRPVSMWEWSRKEKRFDLWIDKNADGVKQEEEKSRLSKTADGNQLLNIADKTSSLHMESNGDLYFVSMNQILKIPAKSLLSDGQIEWDLAKASLAVPVVFPGMKRFGQTWRTGILGVRLDSQKNIYTAFNVAAKGFGGKYDYPSETVAKEMLEGLGHTSTFNAVKFAKYDAKGDLQWMAGRKATAGAKAGEMYHFWNLAGIVNDKYVAGGSEWGQIYFYTHDGFFVDALMNNPAEAPAPGPYTFGGETSGARVQYFPEQDELWAYSTGKAYRVKGFKGGEVNGENRVYGKIELDKTYEKDKIIEEPVQTLRIVPTELDLMSNKNGWSEIISSKVVKKGRKLGSGQLAYDDKNLYGRMEVIDPSPMVNAASQLELFFKGGDIAGVVLGPKRGSDTPGQGDIRISAVMLDGVPKLLAMKQKTSQKKAPFEYYTPANGKVLFEYVGEVTGGEVKMEKTSNGYEATFAVPLSFLEFNIWKESSLRGDIDLRYSGNGQRGVQAVSRNYLYTPDNPQTTMTDDIPTEARLYPQYWGPIVIE